MAYRPTFTGPLTPQQQLVASVLSQGAPRFGVAPLPPNYVAAIVGNMGAESGASLDPHALGDQGTAHGIGQWHGSRWSDLQNFASQNGLNPLDRSTQALYYSYSLQNGRYNNAWQNLNPNMSAADAAKVINKYYEGSADLPGSAQMLSRVGTATMVANAFANGQITGAPAAQPTSASPITGSLAGTAALSNVPPPAPTLVNAAQSFAEPPAPTPVNYAAVNAEATAPGSATRSLNDLPPATTADQLRQQLAAVDVLRPQVNTGNALGNRILNDALGQNALDMAAIKSDYASGNPATFGMPGFQNINAGLAQAAISSYLAANPQVAAQVRGLYQTDPMTPEAKSGMQTLFGSLLNSGPVTPPQVPIANALPNILPTARPDYTPPAASVPATSFAAPQLSYNPASAQSMVAAPIASSVIRQSINPNPYSTAAPQNLYSGAPLAAANTAISPPSGSVMPFTPGVDNAMPGPDISSGPMPSAQLGIAGASGLQGFTPGAGPGRSPSTPQIPTGANPPLATPDTFPLAYGPDAFHVGGYTPVSDIVPAPTPVSTGVAPPGNGGVSIPGAPASPVHGVIGAVLHGLGNLFSGGTSANNGGFYSATVPGGYVSNYGFGSLGGGQFGNMGAASQFGGGAYGAPNSTT